jgi:subtilisin family serine protease
LIALVAPEAKIIPIRVLDTHGLGNTWVLAEALAYAVDPDGNPATRDGADVINLSLSTLRRTSLLKSVLEKVCGDSSSSDFPAVANPNLIVVAAAGNGGDFVEQYPAAENLNGLIAVAASTSTDQLATFSTRGSWIRVAAPGQGITSTVPGGQYAVWSGTSMAAPLVAAEAALVHAQFPTLGNQKIVDQIGRTAIRIDGPVSARIDVANALTTPP